MRTLDRKGEHLATLRAIAQRMAVGALLLEGWSCVAVAALLAVAQTAEGSRFAWLALFLAISFWLLPVDGEAYAWRSLVFQRRLVWFHGRVILAIGAVRALG